MNLEDEDDPRSGRSAREVYDDDPESAREAYDDDFNYEAVTEPAKSSSGRSADEDDESMMIQVPLEPLTENIYGFAMASLIQDSADLNVHPRHCCHSLRALRIFGALLLSVVMFSMQIFLIVEAKKLITPKQVSTARKVYGKFERTMYFNVTENKSHTWETANGFPRGYDGYFNASNFALLDERDKNMVCRVPLSQPFFLFGVLFIWTLTVLAHMRTSINLCVRMVHLPTIDTMQRALNSRDDGTDEVVGLTHCLKFVLVFGVQVPRIAMNCILLWLGARWLVATLGFGDLFLNALALEFILNLSWLLYDALVPHNSKLLVQKTQVPHLNKREHENCANMFGMFLIGLLAALLVISYMFYFQAVLPGYKFDVSRVCASFLNEELALDGGQTQSLDSSDSARPMRR